jgi:ribonuclease HI
VVNAIEQGWARKWRSNGWMRNRKERRSTRISGSGCSGFCLSTEVKLDWVRGHSGNARERAGGRARGGGDSRLGAGEVDEGYEALG